MSRLGISTEARPDDIFVALSGDLDIATAADLERTIADAQAGECDSVTIDLRGLEFIDSTGLRVLLAANVAAERLGQRLVLVRGPEPVDRVFRIALLEERFEIVDEPPGPSR